MKAELIVSLLNDLLVKDEEFITTLVNNRISCNSMVSENTNVVCVSHDGKIEAGLIGVINALVSDNKTIGAITCKDTGKIYNFDCLEK